MIQDVNFWIQFVCGIIVGRGVIAEINIGRKFLNFVSQAKLMLVDGKINFIVDILVGCFLFFLFEIPFVVFIGCFLIWLNIPIFLQQHKIGIPTWKILGLKSMTWIALGLVVWHRAELTIPYPYSLASMLTSDKDYIFWYGFIGIVLIGMLCDYIILKFSIGMREFITSDKVFIFATIMFFAVCPIVEYSRWNTFQDIVKSVEAKKESLVNRLPSFK